MNPTLEQLQAYWRISISASNLLQPINLVRLDQRNNHIVVLVANTLQVEILPNGEVIIQ